MLSPGSNELKMIFPKHAAAYNYQNYQDGKDVKVTTLTQVSLTAVSVTTFDVLCGY